MPTPVNTAKQCLNAEASHALDEAVTVTRRRGHAQTTSLHAVSAFLSLSPSQLREACVRAKNTAFYPKVQLKALDFCLSVSLDRLPISQTSVEEPKISNSLMAAIKRSQANQRRHPDHSLISTKNNQVGHCHQEQIGSSSSGVKVELQHLIVSILDDPIVSRVFNDAGFSSFDVKLSLFKPFQSYFRYPPSVFSVFSDPGNCRFRFPFSDYDGEEGDYRRIGEVLVRKNAKNPLLVGVNANDVLKGFIEVLERRKKSGFLPLDIHGINVYSIEKDILKFVTENWTQEAVSLRLREVDLMVQQCLEPGLLVSFGSLRSFFGGNNEFVMDLLNYVLKKLSKLLEIHGSRVWLIGSAVNDQMYMEFLRRFPSIGKDWDLQPLPITSVRPSMGESCFKSSLLGSFVPLGGFFSSPDVKGSFSNSYQYATRCGTSSENFELPSNSNRRCMASVTDEQTTLPSCLQKVECGTNDNLDNLKLTQHRTGTGDLHCTIHRRTRPPQRTRTSLTNIEPPPSDCAPPSQLLPRSCTRPPPPTPSPAAPSSTHQPPTSLVRRVRSRSRGVQAKGGKMLLSAPVAALQEHQGYLRQCQYHIQTLPKPDVCEESFQLPADVRFQCHEEKVKNLNKESSCTTSSSSKECKSYTSMDLQKRSLSQSNKPVLVRPLDSGTVPAKLSGNPPKTERPLPGGPSSPYSLPNSGADDGQTSPSSVCTDLGLELFSQAAKQQKKPADQSVNNSEALFKALFGSVGRQCEALRIISQIVVNSWTSNGTHQKSGFRGDIWLKFTGPDIYGKRKVALTLAEILYGSKKNFIHVDLCSRDVLFPQKTVFGRQTVNWSRGKTIVDDIAEYLRKLPSCVVLFENVHCADPLLQHSLLQAIKEGKFSDSYGREVATNNRIFVLTVKYKENISAFSLREKPQEFPEERIERAKGCPLQIVVKGVEDHTLNKTGKNYPCQILLNKRKLDNTDEKSEQYVSLGQVKRPHRKPHMSLDLNLPADSSEADDGNCGDTGGDYVSERSESWLDEYSGQLNKTLVTLEFEPFDYDALASKILKLVHASFNEVFESKCLLEIEPGVIDQMIAAACLSDGDKEVKDWIDRVLSKGFAEAQKRYLLTARSTVVVATCEPLYMHEQVQEAYLPSKIILT
ncbi:Protein SMAX1-LIKE 8 [Bienertia sinuspersici]